MSKLRQLTVQSTHVVLFTCTYEAIRIAVLASDYLWSLLSLFPICFLFCFPNIYILEANLKHDLISSGGCGERTIPELDFQIIKTI
jgi:hypothetical protein